MANKILSWIIWRYTFYSPMGISAHHHGVPLLPTPTKGTGSPYRQESVGPTRPILKFRYWQKAWEERIAVLHKESNSNIDNFDLNQKIEEYYTNRGLICTGDADLYQIPVEVLLQACPHKKNKYWKKRNFSMQPLLKCGWFFSKSANNFNSIQYRRPQRLNIDKHVIAYQTVPHAISEKRKSATWQRQFPSTQEFSLSFI